MIKRAKQNKEDWIPFESLIGIVRLILIVDWDPIGVFGHRSTLNEYDSYAFAVAEVLKQDASVETIFQVLDEIEVEYWNRRQSSDEHLRTVAAKLLKARSNAHG